MRRNMESLAIDGGRSIRKTFLPPFQPTIGEEEVDEVIDTLMSGWITTGPKTKKLEEEFKTCVGCNHAIAVNSCTAALHLSLVINNIKKGDEVITSSFTFASTANVIVHQNAKPVFVDIQEDTYNIDPEKIEEKITKNTKAIIPVHYAGHPCEMDEMFIIPMKFCLPDMIFEASDYQNARHSNMNRYTSRDIKPISKENIKNYLLNRCFIDKMSYNYILKVLYVTR